MARIVADMIELQTYDAGKLVRLSQVEKFEDGSGYQCELTVASNGFSCQ